MLRDCGVVGVDDRPQSERQRDDRGGAIEPAQDGRDSVFGDQPFEPDHVERRNAGAEQNQDVAPQVRMGVGGRDARQYDGDGSRHAERETGDFEFREAIHSQQHRDDQHEQRNDRVDDRSVDGRRHRESVHDEDLAQHADEQCGPDQSADVGACHLFGFLPGERNERQQRRCDQRARYHGHRVDVLGQYDVVEGIVHRPKDVAHQQGDVGFEFAHPACRFPPPETKTMPAEYLPVRTRKPESRFRLSCFRSGSSLELLRRAAPRAAVRPRRSTHSASRCRPCGGSGPARGRCAAKGRGQG